jgi:hypothetical protein
MLPFRLIVSLLVAGSIAQAGVIWFTGVLDPAQNPNLTYWDPVSGAYTAPIAGPEDQDCALNIALHTFSVEVSGLVTFDSLGYGQGGFDSVISVFEGTGDTAAYLHHEAAPVLPGDFGFDLNLGAGDYTLTVGMFLNEPCAAGFCFVNGELGDGFTNLVNFDAFRSQPLFYDVSVTTPIPEPSYAMLFALGLTAALARKRFRSVR